MTPHTVIAYRNGSSNDHSYVVGSYPDRESARRAASAEQQWRDGKYGVAVLVGSRAADDPDTLERVDYFPSRAGEDQPSSSSTIDAAQYLGMRLLHRTERDSYQHLEELARAYAECLDIPRVNFEFPPEGAQ